MTKPLYVTQPYLPPLEEFIPYLKDIWDSKQLTNGGPMHQALEVALCEYLGVKHISLFNNGTIALIVALQALGLKGEVITTPYTFVATAHALLWNNLKPVFVDIDPDTLNLDPNKIEAAITAKTCAILPVHCYGTPCDTQALQKIADRNGLKIIYDAAHAFGVRDSGGSILRHGDLSVLSFHATKVFNTFEGGAVVSSDAEVKNTVDRLKNFGIIDEITVDDIGLNGKMAEINAAMGLLQLKYIDNTIASRKNIDYIYRQSLEQIEGIKCVKKSTSYISNYAYFPILLDEKYPIDRDKLYHMLQKNDIYSRRYFYPLVSEFTTYKRTSFDDSLNHVVAQRTSKNVLCLPIYPAMEIRSVEKVINIIASWG